jgi:hypothetical protein
VAQQATNVVHLRRRAISDEDLAGLKKNMQEVLAGYDAGTVIGNACVILMANGAFQVVARGVMKTRSDLMGAIQAALA